MAWNQDGYTGDQRTQAAQMAKDHIEESWGGTAYTRVTTKRNFRGDLIAYLGVQMALVEKDSEISGSPLAGTAWSVTAFNPWVTDDGKLKSTGGSGVGKGFATEADAVVVAKALIKADWS